MSLFFPSDPEIWMTRLGPPGALEASLQEDFRAELAPWFNKDMRHDFVDFVTRTGLAAATKWYKVVVNGMAAADEKRTLRASYLDFSMCVY